MRIVVDGNNLLHAAPLRLGTYTQESLLRALIKYKKVKMHNLIVVFDSGPLSFPTKIVEGGVTVIYAGRGNSADDQILEYLKKERYSGETILISSDRALCQSASKFQVYTVDTESFASLLMTTIRQNHKQSPVEHSRSSEKIQKFSATTNPELDRLLSSSTPPIKKEEDEEEIEKTNRGRKMSKPERNLSRILKKL
jgi:predicted RNA-binding protein with PIN domain